jgi:ElaB/YqjD/DUF883 family membrane-anchored ribosome-binding protein
LKKKWDRLTAAEIEKIEGSYKALLNQLTETYGYKKAEAEHEIEDFLDGLNLKDEAKNFKESIIKNTRYLKDKTEQVLHDSSDELYRLKDKTLEIQKDTISYVKKNPAKAVGLALMAGLLAGLFLKK